MSDCIYHSTLKQTGTFPSTHTHSHKQLSSCVWVLLNPQCVAIICHLAKVGIQVKKSLASLPCPHTLVTGVSERVAVRREASTLAKVNRINRRGSWRGVPPRL